MDERTGVRRFIVFGYDSYYPGGGFNDALADFNTREEAEGYVKNSKVNFDHLYIEDLHETPDWRNCDG